MDRGEPSVEEPALALFVGIPRDGGQEVVALALQPPAQEAVSLEADDEHEQQIGDSGGRICQPEQNQSVSQGRAGRERDQKLKPQRVEEEPERTEQEAPPCEAFLDEDDKFGAFLRVSRRRPGS